MATRLMKAVGVATKKISFKNTKFDRASSSNASGASTSKGHFAAYSANGKRFMLPLKWLGKDIFAELLRLAEEEFGLPSDGPIVLPFDGSSMEEIIKLMERRHAMKDHLKSDLASSFLVKGGCSTSSSHVLPSSNGQRHILVC